MAAEAGHMELNAFEPVLFYNLFDSVSELTHAVNTLRVNCIDGITANEERCGELLNASVGIATALNPYIGYRKAAEIAKKSLKTSVPVKELVLQEKLMTAGDLEQVLDAYSLTSIHTGRTASSAV